MDIWHPQTTTNMSNKTWKEGEGTMAIVKRTGQKQSKQTAVKDYSRRTRGKKKFMYFVTKGRNVSYP